MSITLPEIDFRQLSEIHTDRPEFVTLYLNTPDNEANRTFIENRKRDIMQAVGAHGGIADIFEREIDNISEEVTKRGARGDSIAIFACKSLGIFDYHTLPLPMDQNLLILDTSPYIKPLAVLYDDYEPFLIVMVDHNNGVIHSVAGTIEDTDAIHKDIMNHHRKGGWSQMRYQRIREGNILHLFKEVAEKTSEIAHEEKVGRIVLAGPKDAKKKFYEELSKDMQAKVIGYADIGMKASYDDILDEAYELFFKKEQEEDIALMDKLRGEIFKGGGLASVGPKDTVKALNNGRVQKLVMDPAQRGGGWKCEKCGAWGIGSRTECTECTGGSPVQVDVYEEAVEEAKKMDSEIEFVKDDEFLQSIGGMAALLRW